MIAAWSAGVAVEAAFSGRPGRRRSVGASARSWVASSYARLLVVVVAVRIASTDGAGSAKRSASDRATKRMAAASEEDKAETEATSVMRSFCLRLWSLVYLPASG